MSRVLFLNKLLLGNKCRFISPKQNRNWNRKPVKLRNDCREFRISKFNNIFNPQNKPNVGGINSRFMSKYYKHKYDSILEDLMNCQINCEFNAGYTYLDIASYYGRSDVALPGLHGFFMKMFYEELGHALKMIDYQIMRGGVVKYTPIKVQEHKCNFENICEAFCLALQMEKDVTKKIQDMHSTATDLEDTNVQDFLDEFIMDQEKSIREMARYVTRVSLLCNCNLGKYLFDRELHQTHIRKSPPEPPPEFGSKLYS